MAKRLQMDDWPMDLVRELEEHSESKVDCIFLCPEFDSPHSAAVEGHTYMIHAHKGDKCAMEFCRLIDGTVVLAPDGLIDDSIYKLFSFCVHSGVENVDMEFRYGQ